MKHLILFCLPLLIIVGLVQNIYANDDEARTEDPPNSIVTPASNLSARQIGPQQRSATDDAKELIRLDEYHAKWPQRGEGETIVILGEGTDLTSPLFQGCVAAQYDSADLDNDATSPQGLNTDDTALATISVCGDNSVAPGANVIFVKAVSDNGSLGWEYVERGLQWVVENVETYNIVAVDVVFHNSFNHTEEVSLDAALELGDELVALAEKDVVVVTGSGDLFLSFGSVLGTTFIGSTLHTLAVCGVYDKDYGQVNYTTGEIAYTTGSDRIIPVSQ